MNQPHPAPGFRFSWQDAAVLAGAGILTWLWWRKMPAFAPALPIVLGHFFLFCNVFRISRRSELIWAGCFLVNATIWMMISDNLTIDWFGLMLVQTPITVVLILREMRRPGYHGIGWSRLKKSHER